LGQRVDNDPINMYIFHTLSNEGRFLGVPCKRDRGRRLRRGLTSPVRATRGSTWGILRSPRQELA